MRLNLQIKFTANPTETKSIVCTASDIVKLEGKYDISVASLENSVKITHLLFLAWASETRTKATTLSFEEWVDTVDSVTADDQKK